MCNINDGLYYLQSSGNICKDDWSGRYFPSSVERINLAVAELNMQRYDAGEVSMNDFYDLVGLDPIPIGEKFGWIDTITVRFSAIIAPDNRPAISFWLTDPTYSYTSAGM